MPCLRNMKHFFADIKARMPRFVNQLKCHFTISILHHQTSEAGRRSPSIDDISVLDVDFSMERRVASLLEENAKLEKARPNFCTEHDESLMCI